MHTIILFAILVFSYDLGVPKQPDNFTFHDVNATHINLVWDEPFSWIMPVNITYVLVLEGPYIPKTIELSTHSFPLLRTPGGLYARLTPRNPVGEGESTTLNLTDSVLGCDKIGMLNQRSRCLFHYMHTSLCKSDSTILYITYVYIYPMVMQS